MKPGRAEQAERRAALEQKMRASRARLEQKLRDKQDDPRMQAMREAALVRRRRNRAIAAIIVVIIIILLLLRDCGPGEPAEGPPAEGPPRPVEVEEAVEEEVKPHPVVKTNLTGSIKRQDRPEFVGKVRSTMPWLDSLRMQVSARSPRLAGCFVGTERPGRLKWTTSVDPVEGTVSEHDLAPVLGAQELSKAERACVLDVLTDPSYRLEVDEVPTTPPRVGLVIEF